MTEYIVPYQDAESEFTEKRSRFITTSTRWRRRRRPGPASRK